jgi:peroxiredoxin
MDGAVLGIASGALILGVGARWWQRMHAVRLPANATRYVLAVVLAAALGAAALVRGPGIVGGIGATLALVGGLAFLGLFAASGQRRTPPAVAVGAPVLDLVVRDDVGRPFALANLRGRPVLLKFFRGHWCPYCVAELRRWELEIRPALDALGVAIVTVCADRADEIRAGRAKHGLHATMLPDPDLAITDRFGLRNPRNVAPRPGVVIPLPIPTTILVDADGVVRWIDQASDYMRRSHPDVVRAVLRDTFGEPGAVTRDRQRMVS